MRPVGEAAVVQVTGINKGTYIHIYQSAMSLLVIDFTYLDGRDGNIVVKEFATVDYSRNIFHRISLKDRTVGR